MARVVIVGGGIAGVAAAWLLREHDVTVIDGAGQLGGKLRTSDVAGMAIDEGAGQLPRVDGSLMVAVRRALPTSSSEPVFATVRGGLQQLVEAVIEQSRAQVIPSRLVRRLERTSDRWRVVHGATVDERAVEADAVV